MKLPFWATFLTVLGVCVLCGLGSWQVQRLAWKGEIVTKLVAAYEGESSDVIDFAALEDDDFAYGRVAGVFRGDKAILLGPRVQDKQVGKDLIVPLETSQGVVFLNLGWTGVPDAGELALPRGQARFDGLARVPGWNGFTPENDPEQGLWFKADLKEMAEFLELEEPVRFMLYAYTSSFKLDGAFPNHERWMPKDNHLQYALFWFAMAGTLIVIYALRFLRKP